jgi:hypothetical protein
VCHNLLGRSIVPESAPVCHFPGYRPISAAQYLTTDGMHFRPVPLKGGGSVRFMEYASHVHTFKSTWNAKVESILGRRCVFKLMVDPPKGVRLQMLVIFKELADANNFLLKVKGESITYLEIHELAVRSNDNHDVIGRIGTYEFELRKA